TLNADSDGLAVHGTEPSTEAPLFRASKVRVGLKIVSLMKQQFDVALVEVHQPQINLLLDAHGNTNVPTPKTQKPRGKSVDETILDLKVARFDIERGVVEIKAEGQGKKRLAWNARGENLKAVLDYAGGGAPNYHGVISMRPLHATYGSYGPLDASVDLQVKL